jgi:hypothetical protein
MQENQSWTEDQSFGNWDEVSTEGPAPLEPGVYSGEIVRAEPKLSKAGKPMIELELYVTRRLDQPADIKRRAFDRISLVESVKFRIKQLCNSTGVRPPASTSRTVIDEFCQCLQGQAFFAKFHQKEYLEKLNHSVERYLSPDEARKTNGAMTGNGTFKRVAR